VWQVPAAAQVRGFVQERLTEAEAAELWKDLASPDANQSQKALVRLAQDAKTAVALAEKTLQPAIAPPGKAIQALIQDLDSDSFKKREAAMASLETYGETISDHLKAAVEKSESAEIRSRCKQLSANAGRHLEQSAAVRTQSRAVQLLEWCGTTEAAVLLKKLAGGASEAEQTKAAKAALARRQ
jgi:hypothetical protein